MRPEVQWRMEASDRDEQMARQLLASGFYEGCAFHSQQAAEKALKAALIVHGHAQHTQSCMVLLETIEKFSIAPVPPDLLTMARREDWGMVIDDSVTSPRVDYRILQEGSLTELYRGRKQLMASSGGEGNPCLSL